MPALQLSVPLDLAATLLGGQSFCWNEAIPGEFAGWIRGHPVTLTVRQRQLVWDNPLLSPATLHHYLSLDLELDPLLGLSHARDPWLPQARETHPGLRPLREDPWECLANFICSSLKQIVQIRQINERLRRTFGGPTRDFPSPQRLARAGEKGLRQCQLGYRAKHLAATAKILANQPELLDIPESWSTERAAEHLEELPGVGPKISRCVLLYAYARWDAFPVDVWVTRLLRQLYFPKRRKPLRLQDWEQWSEQQFGPSRGLAQLALFHWYRTRPGARSRI
ncbi:MAG: hypothetical protein FJ411_03000 [Verrucomicrobia bacterium]|nr:hypothetical protein [Verrucomicrobiota bacterium]